MYQLLVTGDVPGASSYFNPLVQQSIIPVTSGTRPTASHEGMTIHESDTNSYAKWNGSAWEYVAGTRASYTPSLTATTTPPTLGTGSSAQGWWCYVPGGGVLYTFNIAFGSTGVNVGNGQYQISLPVTASGVFGVTRHAAVGTLLIADSSASIFRTGSCFVPANNLNVLGLTADVIITNSAPWTWSTGDYLSGSIYYPV